MIKLPWIDWSLWRIQKAIFTSTRACKCEPVKLLNCEKKTASWDFRDQTELWFGECLCYKQQKQSSALPVAARWRSARWGSKWATATTASKSWFRQFRNSALPHTLLSPWLLLHGNWYGPAFLQSDWLIAGPYNTIRTTFFQLLQKIVHFSSLRCSGIGSSQNSTKFLSLKCQTKRFLLTFAPPTIQCVGLARKSFLFKKWWCHVINDSITGLLGPY